ncbi:MAG: 2OG-Fe(II) oxygenase [Kofleriaceae bacterium]
MSVWQLPSTWTDEHALREAWQAADPFPHLIVDDFAGDAELPRLLDILEDEPVERYANEIYAFEASAPEPVTDAVRSLRNEFADVLSPVLSRVTGKPVRRVDLRAYAYRVGHYLLPHTDHQDGLKRALAYAYYLPSPEPPRGGELELFRCEQSQGVLTSTVPARLIEPRANRLVVFDVSDVSLHQVREVLGGLRISLAGWFYP